MAGLPKHNKRIRRLIERDIAHIDLRGTLGDSIQEIVENVTAADNYVGIAKKIAYFNAFVRALQRSRVDVAMHYPVDKLLFSIRKCLTHSNKAVRAGALRSLRYLLNARAFFDVMIEMKIDLFVMKSLDTLDPRPVERVQALRLVRKILSVCPDCMPHSLVVSLVAAAEGFNQDDKMAGAALETLSELAVVNPSIVSFHRGFKAILRGIIDCQSIAMTESLLAVILYLLNHPNTRCYIRPHVDIEVIIAPFTDVHYRHRPESHQLEQKEDRQLQLLSARTAVVTMLRSWAGLACFFDPSGWGISSFIGVLPLPYPLIQRNIMEVLFDLFRLNVPEWTDDFDAALASTDPCKFNESWRLEEEWIVEEAKHILPHLTKRRTNLLTCYLALILTTFIKAGLLEKLVATAKSNDKLIATQATILLGELLHLANRILPPKYSAQTHCLPSLMETATSFDSSPTERSQASAVVSCLEKIHQKRKVRPRPRSLYLQLILKHSECVELKQSSDTLNKPAKNVPSKDSDDLLLETLLRDSQVLSTKDYTLWNWNVIGTLLKSPRITMKRLEESSTTKFAKRLCYFYKPSSQLFSTVELTDDNVQKYSHVGCQLMEFLLTGDEGVKYLTDAIQEITECLAKICDQGSQHEQHQEVFSSFAVAHTMTRDYFLLLGQLSSSQPGLDVLKKANIFNYFLALCSQVHRRDINRLLLTCLDYSQDALTCVVLSKHLTCLDTLMRKYATSYMRVLLRAQLPAFKDWGIELIITQLYDPDESICNDALDILDEACDVPSYFNTVVLNFPALLHLGPRGASLLTRFLSANRGLWLLKGFNFIDQEMDKWLTDFNKRYVCSVEQKLTECFTSYQPLADGIYLRRSRVQLFSNHDMSVPVHFYGQLVQLREGCRLLQRKRHLHYLIEPLERPSLSQEDILEKKAALWALGHIGTSHWGIQLLSTQQVIEKMVKIAEKSDVMSLKGTAFYSLCLLARTKLGSDYLSNLGWLAVRHSGEESWPVAEEVPAEVCRSAEQESFFRSFDTGLTDSPPSDKEISVSLPERRGSLDAILKSPRTGEVKARARILTEQTGFTSPRAQRSSPGSRKMMSPSEGFNRANRPNVLFTEAERMAKARPFERQQSDRSSSEVSRDYSTLTHDLVGVVVPTDLQAFFSVAYSEYEGSWAAVFPKELDLRFMDRLEKKNGKGNTKKVSEEWTGKDSKSEQTVRKELFKLIGSLGTSVGSRATQQGLMLLKDKNPEIFQSSSIFLEILEILASYHFSFGARRFCYALFDIDFNTFSIPSANTAGSPVRHRNSNGDLKSLTKSDSLSQTRKKKMMSPEMLQAVDEDVNALETV